MAQTVEEPFYGGLNNAEFEVLISCVEGPLSDPRIFYPKLFNQIPHLIDKCNWNMLGCYEWVALLVKYPKLTEKQYNSVLSDLKQPEGSVLYQNARKMLICSHLAMILGMAKDTYCRYYGLSMEDYVCLGNMAMVTKFGSSTVCAKTRRKIEKRERRN